MKRALLILSVLALISAPADAERRQVKSTTRTSVSSNRGTNVRNTSNVSVRNDRNVNVRQNTNVNVRRDVDVDVDVNHRYYGGGYYYNAGPSVGTVVAASVATAIIVGTIVATLPPSCSTIIANGIAYQNCGGTYYQPRYQGSTVTYVVVTHP
jgi:hypothetical protein